MAVLGRITQGVCGKVQPCGQGHGALQAVPAGNAPCANLFGLSGLSHSLAMLALCAIPPFMARIQALSSSHALGHCSASSLVSAARASQVQGAA